MSKKKVLSVVLTAAMVASLATVSVATTSAADTRGKIYFDSTDAVLEESGDILIPLKDGTITENDFTGELGQVLTGEIVGRENDDEIIVFETVGIGTQDLTAARAAYAKAKAAGIGVEW